MFIEGLSKTEREEASRFDPKAFEGEFVKIITSYNPKDKKRYGYIDSISYCKLSEYITTINFGTSKSYQYNGIFVGFEWHSRSVISLKFSISSDYDTYRQCEIVPITREEFIDGCKSLLTPDLQELINWDKV